MRLILEHWGIQLDEKKFQQIFNIFDKQNKGAISYQDLQTSIGHIVHPAEALFFRQDCKIEEPLNRCSDSNCFRQPTGLSDKCILHLKE